MYPSAVTMNQTSFHEDIPVDNNLSALVPAMQNHVVYSIITYFFTFSMVWKIIIFLLVLGNLKNIPLIYHLRLVNAFRFCLRSQRPPKPMGPANIFQPIITTSSAPLMEIDCNLHKSNSSYFSDIDVARTHLLCTLFSKGIEKVRGGTEAITGKKGPVFNLALGAVNCNFKKEIKPYETYEMWTRVLSWDEKWIYIVTHFVRKDSALPRKHTLYPQQDEEQSSRLNSRRNSRQSSRQSSRQTSIASTRENSPERDELTGQFEPKSGMIASALNKCVFKLGRKTIPPVEMLKASGLLPTDATGTDPSKPTEFPGKLNVGEDSAAKWTWKRIDEERQRGLKTAAMLAGTKQQELEEEFTAESEALGRHTDGTGITGVVSTLAQLSHIKRKQIL